MKPINYRAMLNISKYVFLFQRDGKNFREGLASALYEYYLSNYRQNATR